MSHTPQEIQDMIETTEAHKKETARLCQERQEAFDAKYRKYVYDIAATVVEQHYGARDKRRIRELAEDYLAKEKREAISE